MQPSSSCEPSPFPSTPACHSLKLAAVHAKCFCHDILSLSFHIWKLHISSAHWKSALPRADCSSAETVLPPTVAGHPLQGGCCLLLQQGWPSECRVHQRRISVAVAGCGHGGSEGHFWDRPARQRPELHHHGNAVRWVHTAAWGLHCFTLPEWGFSRMKSAGVLLRRFAAPDMRVGIHRCSSEPHIEVCRASGDGGVPQDQVAAVDPATQHAAGGCDPCCCRGRCDHVSMQAPLALIMCQCQMLQHADTSAIDGRSACPGLRGVLSDISPYQGCTSLRLGLLQA